MSSDRPASDPAPSEPASSDAPSSPGTSPLRVAEGRDKDAGRVVVRVDPSVLDALGVQVGDIVAVEGGRVALAKALPTHPDRRGRNLALCGPLVRTNADVEPGDEVTLRPAAPPDARRVVLRPHDGAPAGGRRDVGRLVDGLPVQPGDRVRTTRMGRAGPRFTVAATRPDGPVVIRPDSTVVVDDAADGAGGSGTRSAYDDVGGLGPQLQRIRETIELPLRAPEVFGRLGVAPPTGVLLAGPPGCGKTLLARTIAAEAEASFFSISGPEIIRKLYGESEAQLRSVFDRAESEAPSIVFIDEIDAIAPRRGDVEGDVEKRVVATLLTLMDGLEDRGHVVVIAATNRVDAIDPALRRAGRFDREIRIPIPDRRGRAEILGVHTRDMPLADDVDLDELAEVTHGFVGADLEALCREAAMAALRRVLPRGGLDVQAADLQGIEVRPEDVRTARRAVQPSATREVFTEIPDVRWSDIGGLEEAKACLAEAVEWPLAHPDLFDRAGVEPPRGVLLAGPPGCGKTLLAQAVATETNANFISIKGPALLSKYVGTSEKRVRDIFRKAREAAPCIIFFDEIDALASTRAGIDTDSGVAARVLTQVLTEMDGAEALEDVVVLGATNRIDRIDEALLRPGRFDEIVRIERPGPDERAAILKVHLRDKPVASDVEAEPLVPATEGFSGADIAAACRRAAMQAMRRVVRASSDEGPPADVLEITRADLDRAIEEVGRRQAGTNPPGVNGDPSS